jgi:uncharacterized membrane protein HdeD (DUF308 family)
VVLGVMILAGLPATATTILGLLLGIELVSNGVLFLFVALGFADLAASAATASRYGEKVD